MCDIGYVLDADENGMAWIKVRIIMAKMTLLFDVDIYDKSLHWEEQCCYTLWQKPELFVKVVPCTSR